MTPQPKSVIVVGGGIAGLATAWLIREQARALGQPIELTILEASSRHGGATRTDHINGYTCEWGPNGFLDNEPATLDLVGQLGLSDQLVHADERSNDRFIFHTGRLRGVPLKPQEFFRSDILPLSAKLRMALEPLVFSRTNGSEETIDHFGRRRLGSAFADLLLDPMVSGVFAGNSKELSLKAVFPKMVEMEHEYGSLYRAMIAKKKLAKRNGSTSGGPSGPGGKLCTFRLGMGQLTDTLFESLQANVVTGAKVDSLARRNGGFKVFAAGREWVADNVILASPSHATAEIMRFFPDISSQIGRIEYAPVDVVCQGYSEAAFDRQPVGFGVLIPRSEKIRSLGTLWSDSIFPGQAPASMHLLRTILGGAHDPGIRDLTEIDLARTAHEDNRKTLGVHQKPVFKRLFRHSKGIAQYRVGHPAIINFLDKVERDIPGLFFTGASYRGVSVNGCIKDAFRIGKSWRTLIESQNG